jgi:lambda family phage minor tail protein L
MAVPVSDLQGIAPSAVIELFELQLVAKLHGSTDTYRFHAGSSLNANGPIYWNGNSYTRMPIEADGFEYTGGGQLPQPKLRVSNINGTVTSLLLIVNAITTGNDLIGAKLTRIRTLARYIDATNFPGNVNPYGTPDPTVEFPREVFYISQKSLENRDLVEFTLSAAFDLQGVRAPKRQCISNICQWEYKSTECTYSPVASFTGTYSRTGTTLTVTRTAHGLTTDKSVYLDFTSGAASDGAYTITAYTANTFTVTTAASGTTSGNVTATQWFTENDVPTTTSTADVCGKRLSSCEARFGANNELPFGSFPGVGTYFT